MEEYKGYHENYFKSNEEEREKVWKPLTKYLQKKFKIQGRVLDLGAAYCNFINSLENVEKHAVDLFEDIKKYADKDVKTYVQSCTNLKNFKSGYFDFVFASNLLEHLNDNELENTIKEVKRVLKNDGKIILLQPNFRLAYKNYFDDPTHKKIFTEETLKRFLNINSFEIVHCKAGFLPLSMKSRLPKSRLLTNLYLYSPIKPMAKQMLIVAAKRNKST